MTDLSELVSADAPSSRRTAVLNAALLHIGRDGLQAIRHRAVAETAGVSTSSVAYHFPSREQLLHAALHHAALEETRRVEQFTLSMQADAFDIDRWVAQMSSTLADTIAHEPTRWLASYELQLASARDENVRAVMRPLHEAYRRACELGFRAARSCDPVLHGQILNDAITGALLKQLAYPIPNFEEEALRPIIAGVVRGLVGLPASEDG